MRPGVLILGSYPPPFGGVPRVVEDLVPHLTGNGWRVHVVTQGRSGIEERGGGFTLHRPTRAAHLHALAREPGVAARAVRRLAAVAATAPKDWAWYAGRAAYGVRLARRERIDVIAAYNLFSYAPAGALVKAATGTPLVVTNLGELFPASHRGDFFRRHPGVLRWLVDSADRLVAPTRHCASGYAIHGVDARVEVVHTGVDLERFHPSRDGSGMRERMGAQGPVALYLGRMTEEMGLRVFLDAAPEILRRVPTATVVVAGARAELLPDAEALARSHPGRVRVMPDVPLEDLPGLYAAADVVAVPSLNARACGALAAAEAMGTGKPVVVSRAGGVPEFVEEGETGFVVPPGDAEALADRLVRVLTDAGLAGRLGHRGRERMERLWNVRATNARFEEILREAAGLPLL